MKTHQFCAAQAKLNTGVPGLVPRRPQYCIVLILHSWTLNQNKAIITFSETGQKVVSITYLQFVFSAKIKLNEKKNEKVNKQKFFDQAIEISDGETYKPQLDI